MVNVNLRLRFGHGSLELQVGAAKPARTLCGELLCVMSMLVSLARNFGALGPAARPDHTPLDAVDSPDKPVWHLSRRKKM